MTPRRAIVLRRSDTDPEYIAMLAETHQLEVLFTAVTDAEHPKLSALIAAQHATDHRAEVIVAPYLTGDTVRGDTSWQQITEICDVVTADDVVTPIAP
ncbi:hypothetical protein [Nocardia sp. NPDC003963]